MFCTRCGTKLAMDQMTSRGHGAFDGAAFARGAVQVGIFLFMLVFVLLLIWPATPAGKRGDEEALAALLNQRAAVKKAMQQGQEVKCELAETGLNAYLAATLKAAHSNEGTATAWMMKLAELNVGLKTRAVTVTASSHWGPFNITWQVSGTPQVKDNHFQLDVKSGRIGHMGLPRSGAEWMASRVAVLFNRWAADRELLNTLTSMTVESGSATLVTRVAQAAKE
jgi:hypothetical protein